MYKPNGEERMTKHEELRRRAAMAQRKLERARSLSGAAAFDPDMYASLMPNSSSSENAMSASFGIIR